MSEINRQYTDKQVIFNKSDGGLEGEIEVCVCVCVCL